MFYNSQKGNSKSEANAQNNIKKEQNLEEKMTSTKIIELFISAGNRTLKETEILFEMMENKFYETFSENDMNIAKIFILVILAKNLKNILMLKYGKKDNIFQIISINGRQIEIIPINDKNIEILLSDKEISNVLLEKIKELYLKIMEKLRENEYLISILNNFSFIENIVNLLMEILEKAKIEENLENKDLAKKYLNQTNILINLLLQEFNRWDLIQIPNFSKIVYKSTENTNSSELDAKNANYLSEIQKIISKRIS